MRVRARARPTLGQLDRNEDGPPLTHGDVCHLLGLSRPTVREMLNGGDIRGVRIGRNWRVAWRSMRAYLRRTGMLPLRPEERR